MSGKADFSVDEWDLLRSSPMMASLLVVAASPSGPIGLVQESTGAGKVIMQSAATAQTPLLKTLSEDVMQTMSIPKPPPGATPAKIQEAAAEILRRTSALLTTKATPEETSEVKAWLAKVAQSTAEAAKEGGFLGFGGASVSDQEKAALAMLNTALGLQVAQ
jgi:hypothetical protein